MNYNELVKLMKKAGWYLDRNAKGSHRLWRHPDRPYQITIPEHGSKELHAGLVKYIRKRAGI